MLSYSKNTSFQSKNVVFIQHTQFIKIITVDPLNIVKNNKQYSNDNLDILHMMITNDHLYI